MRKLLFIIVRYSRVNCGQYSRLRVGISRRHRVSQPGPGDSETRPSPSSSHFKNTVRTRDIRYPLLSAFANFMLSPRYQAGCHCICPLTRFIW